MPDEKPLGIYKMKELVLASVLSAFITAGISSEALARGGSFLGAGDERGLTIAEINQRKKSKAKKNKSSFGNSFFKSDKKDKKNKDK